MLDGKAFGRVGALALAVGVGFAIVPTPLAGRDAQLSLPRHVDVAAVQAPPGRPVSAEATQLSMRVSLVPSAMAESVAGYQRSDSVGSPVVAYPAVVTDQQARVAGHTALVVGAATTAPVESRTASGRAAPAPTAVPPTVGGNPLGDFIGIFISNGDEPGETAGC
jgi:hypothetical protein